MECELRSIFRVRLGGRIIGAERGVPGTGLAQRFKNSPSKVNSQPVTQHLLLSHHYPLESSQHTQEASFTSPIRQRRRV